MESSAFSPLFRGRPRATRIPELNDRKIHISISGHDAPNINVRSPTSSLVLLFYLDWRRCLIGCVKPLRLSHHASCYVARRGFTVAEVEEAIRTMPWQTAELERLECRKDFVHGKEWNGKLYTTKQVRPIFVEEASVS